MKGWDAKDWLQVAAVCLFSLVTLFAIIKSAAAATASEVIEGKPFDHSVCQYPDRTTNSPNGCDNSDPCDPASVKGGSGECTTLEAQPEPEIITSQNEEVNEPPQQVDITEEEVNIYAGKT